MHAVDLKRCACKWFFLYLFFTVSKWILKVHKTLTKNTFIFSLLTVFCSFTFLQTATLIARRLKANWRSTWRSTARKITVSQRTMRSPFNDLGWRSFSTGKLKKHVAWLKKHTVSCFTDLALDEKQVSYSARTNSVFEICIYFAVRQLSRPRNTSHLIPVQHVAVELLQFTGGGILLMAYSSFLRTGTKDQTEDSRSSRRKGEADKQKGRKGRIKN